MEAVGEYRSSVENLSSRIIILDGRFSTDFRQPLTAAARHQPRLPPAARRYLPLPRAGRVEHPGSVEKVTSRIIILDVRFSTALRNFPGGLCENVELVDFKT